LGLGLGLGLGSRVTGGGPACAVTLAGTEARRPEVNCCTTLSTAASSEAMTAVALGAQASRRVALAARSARTAAAQPSCWMVRRCSSSGGMFFSMTTPAAAATAVAAALLAIATPVLAAAAALWAAAALGASLAPAPLVAPTLPRAASDALPRCNMAAEFMFDPDNDFSMGKGEGKGEGEGNMMPSEDDMIAFAPIIEYLCPSSRRKLSAASPSLKAATLKLRRALQAKLKKLMKAAARK